MQFKHPELLYALFLLLIPIIIHLFQLRRFKKERFTNVAILKKAIMQTRKSSQLKKWLILATRLLALTGLIFAFAQPFTSPKHNTNIKTETVIYLDNSFSMQANGNRGPLLKRAVQDLVSTVPEDVSFSLITNNEIFRNTSINAIKNDLIEIDYTASILSPEAALLKAKALFSKNSNSLKNIIFISDFQDDGNVSNFKHDNNITLFLIPLKAENIRNIAIDTAFISNENFENLNLHVRLSDNGNTTEAVPLSLFDNEKLIAKTAVNLNETYEAVFTIPANKPIQGILTVDDNSFQFDNTLFFNINEPIKTSVLAISNGNDDYLERIYTYDEFNLITTSESQLDYSIISSQNLIILNELESIPVTLASALRTFLTEGGAVTIIPSINSEITSYNAFLNAFDLDLKQFNDTEKRITSINYNHPLYNRGVFEKEVRNFQYPKVNGFFELSNSRGAAALEYEDGKPFLIDKNKLSLFTASLENINSNFKSSPLIVPTFYNMAKYGLKTPSLYMLIGQNNSFDVTVNLGQDVILKLENDQHSVIPQQQYYNTKVRINTNEIPDFAGIYAVKNSAEILKHVSFNYSRNESSMRYQDLSNLKDITLSNTIEKAFDNIKSETKMNALWKWFVIFAAALLIIEMAILKYFK